MKNKQASFRCRVGAAVVLAVAGLGLCGPAAAVEHGVYMAADYGNTRFGRKVGSADAWMERVLERSFCTDLFCSNPQDAVLDETSLTSKSHGYDVWVGYQFTPWFALEGAYLLLGKTRHSATGTIDAGPVDVDGDGNDDYSGPQPLQTQTTFHTRGPAIAAVGSLELGRYFSVDARAGLFLAANIGKVRLQYSPEDQPVVESSFSISNGTTKVFYGATGNFWITPYFAVRAGFTGSGNGSFGDSYQHYFLGIRYSYGY